MSEEERPASVGGKRKADLTVREEPSALRKKWCYMYSLLKSCGEKTGSCNVPLSYKVEDDGKLHNVGTWLGTQRQNLRKKLLGTFECAQLQGLADKGWLVWGTAVANTSKAEQDEQQWERMYQMLLQYKERMGHCNVPEKYEICEPPDGTDGQSTALAHDSQCSTASSAEKRPLLGRWLERQRCLLRTQALRADRAAKLQTLVTSGLLRVDAKAADEARWQAHYAALLRYAALHGHCNVPYDYVTTPDGELASGSEDAGPAHMAGCGAGSAMDSDSETSSDGSSAGETVATGVDNAITSAGRAAIISDTSQPSTTESGKGDEDPDEAADDHMCYPPAATSSGSAPVGVAEGKRVLKLGAWLNNQRHARHGQRNKLRADRRALLQALVDKGQLKWSAGLLTRPQKWDEMYAALLRHCEGRRSWLAKPTAAPSSSTDSAASAGTGAAPAGEGGAPTTEGGSSGRIESASVAAPATSTTSAAASVPATSTSLGAAPATERAVAVVPSTTLLSHAQLLPFPGSTELSDGTTMAYFPWLQRQLHLLQRAQDGVGSTVATMETGIGMEAEGAGREAGNGKVVVARDRLTSEQVEKLQVLLEKGVTVLRWAATT